MHSTWDIHHVLRGVRVGQEDPGVREIHWVRDRRAVPWVLGVPVVRDVHPHRGCQGPLVVLVGLGLREYREVQAAGARFSLVRQHLQGVRRVQALRAVLGVPWVRGVLAEGLLQGGRGVRVVQCLQEALEVRVVQGVRRGKVGKEEVSQARKVEVGQFRGFRGFQGRRGGQDARGDPRDRVDLAHRECNIHHIAG